MMPDPHWFGPLETLLAKCFCGAAISSAAAQGRQAECPTLRIYVATIIYTGCSAVGIGLLGVHAYGIAYSEFLLATSFCTGLVSSKVLVALQEQVLVSILNWLWTKFTGKDLVGPSICHIPTLLKPEEHVNDNSHPPTQ